MVESQKPTGRRDGGATVASLACRAVPTRRENWQSGGEPGGGGTRHETRRRETRRRRGEEGRRRGVGGGGRRRRAFQLVSTVRPSSAASYIAILIPRPDSNIVAARTSSAPEKSRAGEREILYIFFFEPREHTVGRRGGKLHTIFFTPPLSAGRGHSACFRTTIIRTKSKK